MQNYNDLKRIIEPIFKELHIKYELLDFNDNDLNYSIQISTIGKLKNLNSISALLYFSNYDYFINFFVANIYKVKNTDELTNLLKKLNYINSSIFLGNYYITGESGQQIVYKSSNYCGEKFNGLNKELIQYVIVSFITSLKDLLNLLMENTNNE